MREDSGQRTVDRGIPVDLDRLFDHFLEKMEARGLVWTARPEAQERMEEVEIQKLRKKYLRKSALSFKEICDARIWTHSDGRPLNVRAARSFAQKHARPGEIIPEPMGHLERYVIVTSAVTRLAIQRGHATTL